MCAQVEYRMGLGTALHIVDWLAPTGSRARVSNQVANGPIVQWFVIR